MARKIRWFAIVFALLSWLSIPFVELPITLGLFAQALFLAYLAELK